MIEDFSGGYYRATMDVQEYSDGPVIEQTLYSFINDELHSDEDAPVMMRTGLDAGAVFEVNAESAVPRDVLALPEHLLDESGETNVFVLKSSYIDTVGKYYG
jgi:hypothetical protein